MNQYTLNIPYPNYDSISIDKNYAFTILSHVNGLHSKMDMISLCFYNSIIIQKSHIKEVMESICKTELYHLKILLDIVYILNEDPRLWSCHEDSLEYWSPSYNIYSLNIINLLNNCIQKELYFINYYKNQLQIIHDPILIKLYKRLLLDDEYHLKLLKELLKDQS